MIWERNSENQKSPKKLEKSKPYQSISLVMKIFVKLPQLLQHLFSIFRPPVRHFTHRDLSQGNCCWDGTLWFRAPTGSKKTFQLIYPLSNFCDCTSEKSQKPENFKIKTILERLPCNEKFCDTHRASACYLLLLTHNEFRGIADDNTEEVERRWYRWLWMCRSCF